MREIKKVIYECNICGNNYNLKEVESLIGNRWWINMLCSQKCFDKYKEKQKQKQNEENIKHNAYFDYCMEPFRAIGVNEKVVKKIFEFAWSEKRSGKDWIESFLDDLYEIIRLQIKGY